MTDHNIHNCGFYIKNRVDKSIRFHCYFSLSLYLSQTHTQAHTQVIVNMIQCAHFKGQGHDQ